MMGIRQYCLAGAFLLMLIGAPAQLSAATAGNAEHAYQQARTLAQAGRLGEAHDIYEALADKYPDNPDYLLGLGQTHLWLGQPDNAIAPLERARALAPDYEDVYRVLLQSYLQSGRTAAAEDLRTDARERFGDQPWLTFADPVVARAWRPELWIDGRVTNVSNSDAWTDYRVEAGMVRDPRHQFRAFFVDSERFGQSDQTWGLRGVHAFGDRITGELEFSHSPTARVLPETSVRGQLGYSLDGGWGVLAGLRHMNYTESNVLIGDLTLERYIRNFRLAYTAFIIDSDTAGGAHSHRLQGSYYFGMDSSVHLAFIIGEEVEKPVDAVNVIRSDIMGVNLWGETWLVDDVALTYGVGYTDLDIDTVGKAHRISFNMGLRFRF